MKLDALIAFTQASYRNMKSYFTSKLIEHNNLTNKRIRILKTHLPFKLLRRASSLSNSMLFASRSKFCLRRFFIFLTSDVGSHSVFVTTNLYMAYLKSRENEHKLCSFCRFSGTLYYHSWSKPFRKRSSSL